jgi:hypothetical protein
MDNVNPDMSVDDRIDNKRILRSSSVIELNNDSDREEVFRMSIASPRLRLALVGLAAVVVAAFMGGCPWGP